MSRIEYDNSVKMIGDVYHYKTILQDKINEICKKIGYDDFGVTWHIFDPQEGKNQIEKMMVDDDGEAYGYCILPQKEIWISTLAIPKQILSTDREKNVFLEVNKEQEDILAEVIIDEITHIQTGLNHGDLGYDKKLEDYFKKYYRDSAKRIYNKSISKKKLGN